MRRIGMAAACLLAAATGGAAPDAGRPGGWAPSAPLRQQPIWPAGPPGRAFRPPRAESVELDPNSVAGLPATMVHDVAVPTITVHAPPRGANRHAAMVVFPGGGFQVLAIDLEGTEACDWITAHGITCVLLKYRVPRTDTYGDPATGRQVTPPVPAALQDAQRAIRLTRARAGALGIDPRRIGVIGFSAGGYLVAQVSNVAAAYRPVDATDRLSARPDFAVAAYPGHLCRDGGRLDPTIRPTKATPPTFIVQDWDDRTDAVCNSLLYARALDAAGVPAEVHLFARGDHAFAFRRIGHPVEDWPRLLEGWLREIGVL